jgi:protein-disulfide isomerase
VTRDDTHRHGSIVRTAFDVGSTALMLALAAALVWQSRTNLGGSAPTKSLLQDAPVPAEPIQIDETTTQGAATAQVAVIEFGSFECGACGEFASELKPVFTREYVDTGRVRYMYKNFPLRTDTAGKAAAVAAWCASRQGRFWQMHDWLFASPEHLKEGRLQQPGIEGGLDLTAYSSCRSGNEATQTVLEARSRAKTLGIPATPTFYFGRINSDGRVLVSEAVVGVRSMDAIRDVLNRLLR